jgi:hypothetical protein
MFAVGGVDGRFEPARKFPGRGLVEALLAVRGDRFVSVQTATTGAAIRTRVRELDARGRVGRARDVGTDDLSLSDQISLGRDGTLALAQIDTKGARVVIRTPAGRWRSRFTPLGGEVNEPQAAVAPDGSIGVVAIRPRLYGEAGAYGRVAWAELAPGAKHFGTVHLAPVRPLRRPSAFGPDIAYDGRGRRVVTWIEDPRPDPGGESETAYGRVIASTGQRRSSLHDSAHQVSLLALPQGVLVASDAGPWRTDIVTPVRVAPLSGPTGNPLGANSGSERSFATSPSRTAFAWRGAPDGGIRVAFATLP